jgi:2-phospho-L-lactate transferase/gluconeogenesis factor (CofD/UPF0052 family)
MEWYLEAEDSTFAWENTQDDAKNVGLTIKQLNDHKFNKGHFALSATDTANKIIKNHEEHCETYKDANEYIEKVLFMRSSKLEETEMENELEN